MTADISFFYTAELQKKKKKEHINCYKLPDVWMLRVEGEFRQQEGSIPPTLVNNLQQDINAFSFFTKLLIESM